MVLLIVEHPRIHSPEHFNDIANTPLGSCLMAGYTSAALLDNGFDAEILDARYLTFSEMEETVLEKKPDMLMVHAVYFWENTHLLFDSLARLKSKGLCGPIFLFGFFPSLCWLDLLAAFPQVDGVIAGEPELSAVELAEKFDKEHLPALPGLAARTLTGSIQFQPRPLVRDLDRLPNPIRPGLESAETVSIQASRGCYNGCNFCLVPAHTGGRNPWRGRSTASIVEEISALKDQGKTDFYFVDPNFIGPGKQGRDRALELARSLAGLNITFGMETRSADIDTEIMQALAGAGLQSLLLGLESGSQDVLKRLGKNSTPSGNLAAIEAVRRAGLEPEIGFIMFEQGSTLEDVRQNFEFLKEARLLDRLGRTANLLYHHQIALKGARLYQEALEAGRLGPQGLLGFEGILHYEDRRVAWLAQASRRLCHTVLKLMGEKESDIYWAHETAEGKPFATLNSLLVDQFHHLLELASSWPSDPDMALGEETLDKFVHALKRHGGHTAPA